MSVSLTPGASVHFVLGIFVSMEPADLETLTTEKKINKKIAADRKPTAPHIFHCYYQSIFPLFGLHRDDTQ